MITEIKGKCQFENCNKNATYIACGRTHHPFTDVYCKEHAERVVDEEWPEYETECPNCGCEFGVN